jgi:hypothetical protein
MYVAYLTSTAGRRERVPHGTDECRDEDLLSYLGMQVLSYLSQAHGSVGPDASLQAESTVILLE